MTIPVWVHVIRASDGSGDVSDQQIFQQIDVLNGAFAGQQGFGSGADTPFRFQLANATRTDNSDWFNPDSRSPQETAMKSALHTGGFDALNIYIVQAPFGSLGWATPQGVGPRSWQTVWSLTAIRCPAVRSLF